MDVQIGFLYRIIEKQLNSRRLNTSGAVKMNETMPRLSFFVSFSLCSDYVHSKSCAMHISWQIISSILKQHWDCIDTCRHISHHSSIPAAQLHSFTFLRKKKYFYGITRRKNNIYYNIIIYVQMCLFVRLLVCPIRMTTCPSDTISILPTNKQKPSIKQLRTFTQ